MATQPSYVTSSRGAFGTAAKAISATEAATQKQKQFAAIRRMKAMMEYPTKESYALGLIKNIS